MRKRFRDEHARRGVERVAFLGGPGDRTSGQEPLQGFIAAMRRHGLEPSEELIRECQWTTSSGSEQFTQLLGLASPPSAVVTASGELALGALAAARRAPVVDSG